MCHGKRRGLRRLKEKLKSSCVSPLFSIFYYNTTSLWYRMCGFSALQAILQHQVGVVEIYQFILTLLTWIQHQIPQAEGSVSEDGPCPPRFRGQMQVRVVACASDWPAINQKFPHSPLSSVHLLEWLPELRKTVYFTHYKWKRVYGKRLGKGAKMTSPEPAPSTSNRKTLQTFLIRFSQICRWHHSYGRKRRENKELLDVWKRSMKKLA